MKNKFNLHSAFATLMLTAGLISNVAIAQPVVKVPPACRVVVTGTGAGVLLGPGGIVGNGGVVTMPDPFQVPGTFFNYIPNGTTQTGWGMSGDLSVITTNVPPMPAVQSSGPIGGLDIQSYNENLRVPSESTFPSLVTFARSKGRISVSYMSPGCGGASISFDVYKVYSNTGGGAQYVPPIIGPACWLPSTIYTYSVDQIASDNLPDAIGLDKYYWTITDALGTTVAVTLAYTSADKSSYTFTTPASFASYTLPFTVQLCYGRANPWDGDASSVHNTCVTYNVVSAPTAPVFTTPPPTCLATGVHAFTANYTPVAGSTYTWTCSNSSWTLTPGSGTLAVTTMDDNPGVLTLTVSGACLPATFTYSVTRAYDATVTTIAGPTCVSDGSTNTYTVTSPDPVLNNITCWNLPTGWSFTPANGAASSINLTVPGGTSPGAYTLTGYVCACPGGTVNLTINVKPGIPTGLSGPACVDRNGGPTVSYSCTAVTGATGYTWNLPSGWTCVSGCATNNPTLQPGGTSAGPVSITVTANGTGGCNSNPSAPFMVDYNPVLPASITAGCFSFGVAGTTNITVGSAPAPFYGTYTVTSLPTGLFSSYSVNSAGVITLNTTATASGTYTLLITHVTTACGSSTVVPFVVNVVGNGATLTPIYNPSPTGSDTYIELGAPGTATFTWYINGSLVAGTSSVLVLSTSTPAPGPICVYAAFAGCTTVACAAPGTHGYKEGHHNGNDGPTFNEKVKLFPNPNTGSFKIEIPEFKTSAMLRMIDESGKEVGSYEVKAGENTISNTGLAPGIYYVVVKSDDNVACYKIEVTH